MEALELHGSGVDDAMRKVAGGEQSEVEEHPRRFSPLAPQPQQIETVDRLLDWIRTRDRKQIVKAGKRSIRPREKETEADLQ
jgi:hypothetical protein